MSTSDGEGQESTVCPTCGRDDFDTERAMKLHHTQSHGESIAGIPVSCDECGKQFRRKKSRVEKSDSVYCSIECRGNVGPSPPETDISHPLLKDGDWLRKKYFDENKTTPEIADELGCTQPTVNRWMDKHGIERPSHLRCGPRSDKRLYDKGWLHEQYVESRRSAYDIGHEIGVSEYTVLNWLSRHGIDIRSSGGRAASLSNKPRYGEGWDRDKRRTIRRRANHECEICGLSQDAHLSKYGEKLHVHHITPWWAFEDDKKRNDEDNLMALCRDCHNKWEGIPLRPQ
jgi:ssDNA-binding Zn-finger/Zn-ribbon topoisomerase 1